MTIFNTTSERQKGTDKDYRGSYTQHLTLRQHEMILLMIERVGADADAVWEAWFEEDYDPANWKNISINAAAEIIDNLVNVWRVQQAITRKALRTEQEQHDYEMGW